MTLNFNAQRTPRAPFRLSPQRRPRFGAVLALTLLIGSASAWAERHALLVGVSNYPSLDAKLQLDGPKNDILLVNSVLLRRGFKPEQITTLADGVAGAADPTRAAILGAFDALVARAKPGDYVYIHFAGHGSQQPVDKAHPAARNEADGLFEIFLPRDIGKWNDTIGRVENAIADHELAARLDALLAKDVFVFAVFDACHSATLMRGTADDAEVKYRQVSPSALGVSQARIDLAQADAVRTRGAPASAEPEAALAASSATPRGRGGYVAFYAAQTTETTHEMRLPAGHPQRKSYGLFGYTIAEALGAAEGMSYRQLGQYVLQRYAAQNVASPTPLFGGTHLDAPVFGATASVPVRQWPLVQEKGQLSVAAGVLNQLSGGETLALVASPLAGPTELIGHVQIERLDVLNARLKPVAVGDRPALAVDQIPAGAYVRQTAPQVNLKLRVVPPAAGAPTRVATAVDAIQKQRPRGVELQWVSSTQEADLRLATEDGKLWLVSASGALVKSGPAKTMSIEIDQPGFEDKLTDSLQRVGKALNLVRISSQLEGTAAARNLELTPVLVRKNGARAALASLVPSLFDGDVVEIGIRNKGKSAIDLTALYVDADWGIGVLYPTQPGAVNRIEAGASDVLKIDIHDGTTGLERLLLIAVEARAGAERYDFSFMSQAQLERTRGDQSSDPVHDVFLAAGFGEQEGVVTRGAKPQLPGRTEMRLFQWRVVGK